MRVATRIYPGPIPYSLADDGSNADDFIIIPGVQSNGIRPFTIRARKAYEFYDLTATSTGLTSAFLINLEVTAGLIDSFRFCPDCRFAGAQRPDDHCYRARFAWQCPSRYDLIAGRVRSYCRANARLTLTDNPFPRRPSDRLVYNAECIQRPGRMPASVCALGAFDVIDSSNVL
jgi:hypothetical protein